MDEDIRYPDDDWFLEQEVEILEGAFAGFRCTAYSIDRVKKKVVVKVNFWGRDTPVELDFNQIKPVK